MILVQILLLIIIIFKSSQILPFSKNIIFRNSQINKVTYNQKIKNKNHIKVCIKILRTFHFKTNA